MENWSIGVVRLVRICVHLGGFASQGSGGEPLCRSARSIGILSHRKTSGRAGGSPPGIRGGEDKPCLICSRGVLMTGRHDRIGGTNPLGLNDRGRDTVICDFG